MDTTSTSAQHGARGQQDLPASLEQSTAALSQARSDARAALRVLGKALMRDAQLRMTSALWGARRRFGDAELNLELLLSRVPVVGPKMAMDLHGRTHPDNEEQAWPTRPSNALDAEDEALERGEAPSDYLDCIGMHVA